MNSGETCSAIALDELMRAPAPARTLHQDQPPNRGPSPGDEPYRNPQRRRSGRSLQPQYPVVPKNWGRPSSKKRQARLNPTKMGYLELDGSPQTQQQVEDYVEPRERKVTSNPEWMWQFDLLWVAAILLYGIGDLATTAWAFSLGASELNPILDPIIQNSMWKFIQFKALVIITLMLLSTWLISVESDARVVPLLTAGVGLFLMANNLTVIGDLKGWF